MVAQPVATHVWRTIPCWKRQSRRKKEEEEEREEERRKRKVVLVKSREHAGLG